MRAVPFKADRIYRDVIERGRESRTGAREPIVRR